MAVSEYAETSWASYAIFEARGAIGGTWDLFRYPGVRSDSDMFTLGYAFRPWKEAEAIADGPSIRRYIENPLSSRIIGGEFGPGDTVVVDRAEEGLSFEAKVPATR